MQAIFARSTPIIKIFIYMYINPSNSGDVIIFLHTLWLVGINFLSLIFCYCHSIIMVTIEMGHIRYGAVHKLCNAKVGQGRSGQALPYHFSFIKVNKNATWCWQWAHLVVCTCDMHFLTSLKCYDANDANHDRSWVSMKLKDFPIGDCDMSQVIIIHHERSKLFQ